MGSPGGGTIDEKSGSKGGRTALSDRFDRALAYAADAHRLQFRKSSGVPYLGHLLSVAGLVVDHGGTEDEAIAALLHDVVEDQGGEARAKDVLERFGTDVAAIVAGCTEMGGTPKPPWRTRKDAYLARLRVESASVKLVAAADKVHNARSLVSEVAESGATAWEKFHGGKDGTLWFFRAVADALRTSPTCRGALRLAGDLDDLVERLERTESLATDGSSPRQSDPR